MSEENAQALPGPDLRAGVKFDELVESQPLLGHFDGEPVILTRQKNSWVSSGSGSLPSEW